MYYRSNITGRIITTASVIDEVYGTGTVDSMLRQGMLEKIESPDMIDVLRHGSRLVSIMRYRDIHQCGLAEARDRVAMMLEDLNKFSSYREGEE